jgi:GxxExxY protein
MDADEEVRLNQITEKIIGCAYRVGNTLGCGFLEKVYENAMAHELRKANLQVEQQRPIEVMYDGVRVGDYYADLLVEGIIIIELKAIRAFEDIHSAQCIHYLTATGYPICLLINFGKRVDVKRFANTKQTQQ